jgi:glycosyltransferase involved in cell wall biosynthesis
MNVLYLAEVYPEVRNNKWVDAMRAAGAEVLAVSFRTGTVGIWDGPAQDVTIKTRLVKNPFSPAKWFKVMRVLRQRQFVPTVVFVRDTFQALVAWWIARAYRCELVVDVADNFPEVASVLLGEQSIAGRLAAAVLNFVEGTAYRTADVVIVVAEASARLLSAKHGPRRGNATLVIPNVPTERARPQPTSGERPGQGGVRGVYLGTYDQRIRDFATVLSGLRRYSETARVPVTVTVHTFEPGPLQEYLAALDPDYARYITVGGAMDNVTLVRRLGEYDFGLVPHVRSQATDYTVPNKLYDYLLAGLPVLASDNPSLLDVLAGYPYGVTYEGGNPDSFALVLGTLVDHLSDFHETLRTEHPRLAGELSWEPAFAAAWGEITRRAGTPDKGNRS